MRSGYFFSLVVLVVFFSGVFGAWAQEEVVPEEAVATLPESRIVRLNENTVKRGITIGSKGGEVVLGIPPAALSGAGEVALKFAPLEAVDIVDELMRSEGWKVAVVIQEGIAILKPLTLVVRTSKSDEFPALSRYDQARGRWESVKTVYRWKKQEIAATVGSGDIYALFYDTARHAYGRATWYPDRLSKDTRFAAASNEYPLRTRLKVTNVQTDESVVVTVQSVGPFVKGRIVDLTKTAFSKIGYPRKQGVLHVRVEPVSL